MNNESRGRGVAALFGLLVLLAGVIGAVVLFVMSQQRPENAVQSFARASAGCSTTLDFTETGEFFVYSERSDGDAGSNGGCDPRADGVLAFDFEIVGPDGSVVPRRDDSISYSFEPFVGASVARIEITQPGEYEIVFTSDDALTVAAIGRDPDDGVADLKLGALLVGVGGILLGGLLILLSLRHRPTDADDAQTPNGAAWPPAPPSLNRFETASQPQDEPDHTVWAPPPVSNRGVPSGEPLLPPPLEAPHHRDDPTED